MDGTTTIAQRGNYLTALSAKRESSKPWIVDLGMSGRMTGDATVFNTYSPCNDNTVVRVADGTSSRVAGIGSVVISKDITLNSILFPKLDCNLLSINKKDLNSVTKFLPNVCEFQVLGSEKTIGNVRLCASLYLLKVDLPERKKQKVSCVASIFSGNKDSEIMLWHYRLGHPNVLYLRK